jgi:hypothetical protein
VEELRAQATNKRAIRGARLPGVVITETLNRYLDPYLSYDAKT